MVADHLSDYVGLEHRKALVQQILPDEHGLRKKLLVVERYAGYGVRPNRIVR